MSRTCWQQITMLCCYGKTPGAGMIVPMGCWLRIRGFPAVNPVYILNLFKYGFLDTRMWWDLVDGTWFNMVFTHHDKRYRKKCVVVWSDDGPSLLENELSLQCCLWSVAFPYTIHHCKRKSFLWSSRSCIVSFVRFATHFEVYPS